MRGLSSIFNFDTLTTLPKPSASLMWCIGLLVGFRLLAVGAAPDLVARPDILNAAEYLRSARGRDLRVAFFGSSRFQTALLSDRWASRAGLKPGQVANLAVNSGRLWDAVYMLERSGGLPASVELVVIEIAHWEFNRNVRHPVTGIPDEVPERARSWATLSDRLAVDGVLPRLGLLADFVWPLYERRTLDKWPYRSQAPVAMLPPPPDIHRDKASRENLAKTEVFKGARIAPMHFFQASMSEFAKRNLAMLLAQVRNGSRKVVLLQLPTRREYLHVVEQDPAKLAFYSEVQGIMKAYASNDVIPVIWERAEDCGLGEDVFVDYGHLSREGAQALTDRLFDELEARHLLLKHTVPQVGRANS